MIDRIKKIARRAERVVVRVIRSAKIIPLVLLDMLRRQKSIPGSLCHEDSSLDFKRTSPFFPA